MPRIQVSPKTLVGATILSVELSEDRAYPGSDNEYATIILDNGATLYVDWPAVYEDKEQHD